MECKSSSNRQLKLAGVGLYQRDQCIGKVRLPLSRHEDFINDFNRLYSEIGLSLALPDEPTRHDTEGECDSHNHS